MNHNLKENTERGRVGSSGLLEKKFGRKAYICADGTVLAYADNGKVYPLGMIREFDDSHKMPIPES